MLQPGPDAGVHLFHFFYNTATACIYSPLGSIHQVEYQSSEEVPTKKHRCYGEAQEKKTMRVALRL